MDNRWIRLTSLVCLVILTIISCKRQIPKVLCSNNEYSKNGVDSVIVYKYKVAEGLIDTNNRTLYFIEKYDSLGNVIYYKGKYYPHIENFDISDYLFDIQNYYEESYDSHFSFKIDYKEITPTKVSVFNEKGEYIARIEHHIDNNTFADSVYVRDKLLCVKHVKLDSKGRSVFEEKFDSEYSRNNNLTLSEKNINTYVDSGNTSIRESVFTSRDLFFNNNHKYYSSKLYSKIMYDEKGRTIREENSSYVFGYKYNELGQEIESIFEIKEKQRKSLTKNEYYLNGLKECETQYADMTICEGYYKYEYSFYSYSPNYKKK